MCGIYSTITLRLPLLIFQLEPASWDVQTSFLIECRDVFDSDADETAHPLHIDLRELSKLADVFDLTSYVKGNCMAYMIYHFLGERIFLSSVRRYVHTYRYRSANQTDLWSAFQAEIDGANGLPASSGLRMKDVMRTWTYQAGFPVLHVRQNRKTGAIELTQVRLMFIADRSTQACFFISLPCFVDDKLFIDGMRLYDDINHRYSFNVMREKGCYVCFTNKLYRTLLYTF